MKSFVAALIAIAVIGVGSYSILDSKFQKNSEKAFTTTGARIGH